MEFDRDLLKVQQVYDVLDIGTTMPIRCGLNNNIDAVVKYMNNPYGQQILVNELIGNSIAETIGLTIPKFGLCYLGNNAIYDFCMPEVLDGNNEGIAFYSKNHSKTVPPQRYILSSIKNKETEKIILLDHILNNHDRHIGNILFDISDGVTMYTIDHSHIFTKNSRPSIDDYNNELKLSSIMSNDVLVDNEEVYDLLCQCASYDENSLLCFGEKCKTILTKEKIESIKKKNTQ